MSKKFLIVTGGITFVIVYIFYHSLIFAMISLMLLKPLDKVYEKYRVKKLRDELNFQFKDLLYSISASTAAGRQMGEALREGLENMKLIYRDDSQIVLKLETIIKRIYQIRESEEIVLIDFAISSKLEDIENFVDAYLTCRTTGGDVEKVVLKSAALIIDKIALKKEIHALTSQKKFEAKLLTAMPLLMLVFLQIVSPDYLEVMYTTLTGRFLMTLSLVGIILSFYISAKITDIKL